MISRANSFPRRGLCQRSASFQVPRQMLQHLRQWQTLRFWAYLGARRSPHHGMRLNFGQELYHAVGCEVDPQTMRIEPESSARLHCASARVLIADGRLTRVTWTLQHSAKLPTRSVLCCGLVWPTSPAYCRWPASPTGSSTADIVTTTVHKTLGGPVRE